MSDAGDGDEDLPHGQLGAVELPEKEIRPRPADDSGVPGFRERGEVDRRVGKENVTLPYTRPNPGGGSADRLSTGSGKRARVREDVLRRKEGENDYGRNHGPGRDGAQHGAGPRYRHTDER